MAPDRTIGMTSGSGRSALRSGVLIAFAWACSGGPESDLPPIPALAAEDFPGQARQEAERRIAAVRAAPGDPWANGDLGSWLHAHGRLEAARILYRRAEALSGGEFRWVYLLGVAQEESGQPALAAASLRRALARRGYAPAAIRLGEALASLDQPDAAREALREALGMEGGEAAAAYALGRVLIDLDEAAAAIPLLERAIALAPESGAARYALGLAHGAAGNEAEARRNLGLAEGAPDAKPPFDDPEMAAVEALRADEHHFLNLGKGLEAEGRLHEAIAAYERALALAPGMAAAHANLVGAHGRLGDFEKAAAHYAAARAIDERLEELHNNWGVVQAAKAEPQAAAAAFRRALELNPQSAKAHANLGVALLELEDEASAARHFRAALASEPENRPALMNLGVIALKAGRPQEAAEHLEAALTGPPDGSEAYILYALSNAYRGIERGADAVETARRALRAAEAGGQTALAAQIQEYLDQADR